MSDPADVAKDAYEALNDDKVFPGLRIKAGINV